MQCRTDGSWSRTRLAVSDCDCDYCCGLCDDDTKRTETAFKSSLQWLLRPAIYSQLRWRFRWKLLREGSFG